MSESPVTIGGRLVGPGQPTYVIAELSANHGGSIDRALELVHQAALAGAHAVKLQTYTPDTMTLPIDQPPFVVGPGSPWEGRRLYDLYAEAQTPWDWHPRLFAEARSVGLDCFSTPFDVTALEFLEQLEPPAYKIASFELVDLDLVRAVAAKGRPVILSTGMATIAEIDAAVGAVRDQSSEVVLLRCNSGYPAVPAEMDLRTITDMRLRWDVPVGLSDHTLSHSASTTAVALGACVIEKHLTMARSEGGPDSSFSLEPPEFRDLVDRIRVVEEVIGEVRYGPSASERPSLTFRRSLWFVRDVMAGTVVSKEDIASLRPSMGLAPTEIQRVLGRTLRVDVAAGSPVVDEVLSPG
ncbi:MAG: pseudaminic acid synthase [Microthrixaceae bacterium]